ncbi:hypothetical protein GPECTOR_6g597 [Gonium pectorale]|uniref:Uncharacterized protein n=1 Tax=Gonium pectorale TaxID=33097 RepID=A0A150GWC7_GONPE|nr:hypothetical protein GPECTOR_6g597 [Gonium pectorale]|eukprot:KXZ53680.1 hypothetical protein GPECTOR_6g597 [Gonium pectorale]
MARTAGLTNSGLGFMLTGRRPQRTAYLLVATHASASDLLAALSPATASAAAAAHDSAATATAAAALTVTAGDPAVTPAPSTPPSPLPPSLPPPLPPLQRLQQLHQAASSALLLQLFLVADVVLALLPTGGGLAGAAAAAAAASWSGDGSGGGNGGWVGGGGGGALAGGMDWLARLRLLQAAKRALCESLCGPEAELQAAAEAAEATPVDAEGGLGATGSGAPGGVPQLQ